MRNNKIDSSFKKWDKKKKEYIENKVYLKDIMSCMNKLLQNISDYTYIEQIDKYWELSILGDVFAKTAYLKYNSLYLAKLGFYVSSKANKKMIELFDIKEEEKTQKLKLHYVYDFCIPYISNLKNDLNYIFKKRLSLNLNFFLIYKEVNEGMYELEKNWIELNLSLANKEYKNSLDYLYKLKCFADNNIVPRAICEGILTHDSVPKEVFYTYIEAYKDILNKNKNGFEDKIIRLLKIYRKQYSIEAINYWILVLIKQALDIGIKVEISVNECPLYLITDNTYIEEIEISAIISNIDEYLEINCLELEKNLKENIKNMNKEKKKNTNNIERKKINKQDILNQDILLTDEIITCDVLKEFNQLQDKASKFTKIERQIWGLFTIARLNQIFKRFSALDSCEFFVDLDKIIDECFEACFYKLDYPKKKIDKFSKSLYKLFEDGEIEDDDNVINSHLFLSYLGDILIEVDNFFKSFNDEIVETGIIGGAILETYYSDMNLEDKEDKEIQYLWLDHNFIKENPSYDEIKNRLNLYKNMLII